MCVYKYERVNPLKCTCVLICVCICALLWARWVCPTRYDWNSYVNCIRISMKTPDMCKLTQFNVDFVCVCVVLYCAWPTPLICRIVGQFKWVLMLLNGWKYLQCYMSSNTFNSRPVTIKWRILVYQEWECTCFVSIYSMPCMHVY